MAREQKRGKGILVSLILILLLTVFCLIAGIAATIPARTEQIYGPANPELSPVKHYQQCLILMISQVDLSLSGPDPQSEVIFQVEQGDSLDLILDGLSKLGLVRHPKEFRAYLIYSGIDTRIQPGAYRLNFGLSELEIAAMISNPAAIDGTVSILAGWRVEEIADSLPVLGLELNPDVFVSLVKDSGKEGYLFPGTYSVSRDISPAELIDLFYAQFISEITPELETQFMNQGLSLHEAVILASIIQREAVNAEEMPMIASVFLNRLDTGLNLGADPTVQYALGYNLQQESWWTNPLSLNDLKLPSSYNTYLNPGLPPGPICNPGRSALHAVAEPAVSPYLYFRAACDGSGNHIFAETFEEHLQNECP